MHFKANLHCQKKETEWLDKMKTSSQGENDKLVFNLLRQLRIHEDRVMKTFVS
jgi:hypothetical protein